MDIPYPLRDKHDIFRTWQYAVTVSSAHGTKLWERSGHWEN